MHNDQTNKGALRSVLGIYVLGMMERARTRTVLQPQRQRPTRHAETHDHTFETIHFWNRDRLPDITGEMRRGGRWGCRWARRRGQCWRRRDLGVGVVLGSQASITAIALAVDAVHRVHGRVLAGAGAGVCGVRADRRCDRRRGVEGLAEGGQRRARVDGPAAGRRGRTGGGFDSRCGLDVVGQGDAGRRQGFPLGLEVVKVRGDGGGHALAGVAVLDEGVGGRGVGGVGPVVDQAVLVCFLDPFVDDGAGPGGGHVGAEDGGLVVEGARRCGVAARLGEEDGDGVVGGLVLEGAVAGGFVGGSTAPLIGVQAEEVEALGGVGATGEVVLQHGPQFCNIGGGVADGDLAVALLVAVGFHVARGGEDVWGGWRAGRGREDLIPDEEARGVVVLLELIEDRFILVELVLSPVWSVLKRGCCQRGIGCYRGEGVRPVGSMCQMCRGRQRGRFLRLQRLSCSRRGRLQDRRGRPGWRWRRVPPCGRHPAGIGRCQSKGPGASVDMRCLSGSTVGRLRRRIWSRRLRWWGPMPRTRRGSPRSEQPKLMGTCRLYVQQCNATWHRAKVRSVCSYPTVWISDSPATWSDSATPVTRDEEGGIVI